MRPPYPPPPLFKISGYASDFTFMFILIWNITKIFYQQINYAVEAH